MTAPPRSPDLSVSWHDFVTLQITEWSLTCVSYYGVLCVLAGLYSETHSRSHHVVCRRIFFLLRSRLVQPTPNKPTGSGVGPFGCLLLARRVAAYTSFTHVQVRTGWERDNSQSSLKAVDKSSQNIEKDLSAVFVKTCVWMRC